MEEPGRLQSMESQRVGHDWASSVFTAINQVWGHNVFLNVQVLKKKKKMKFVPYSKKVIGFSELFLIKSYQKIIFTNKEEDKE